jgi:hypothetical protein
MLASISAPALMLMLEPKPMLKPKPIPKPVLPLMLVRKQGFQEII